MKKIITLLFVAISVLSYSQNSIDSLKERIDEHTGKINAFDERIAVNESDLAKLNNIKVSGYIQTQFEDYQTGEPWNSFFIRRARVKFTYQTSSGVQFVLQPDFSTNNLSLKDAYVVVNLPFSKDISFWAGQFNRPNYEVEYSSTQREVLERSRIIRNLYPGEREIGLKAEVSPSALPLKFQFAVFNGNFTGKEPKDNDSQKDYMFRGTYSFNFQEAGIGIDLGANYYIGSMRSTQKFIQNFDNKIDNKEANIATYFTKEWTGFEIQSFFDFLGGMAIKAEYLKGRNISTGDYTYSENNQTKTVNILKLKPIEGYYLYFIKNIGNKFQFVTRYDFFDPNTNLSGEDAGSDIFYKTWTLALQYYFNDNIRFTFSYEIPNNEINLKNPLDIRDNIFGIRIQAKF